MKIIRQSNITKLTFVFLIFSLVFFYASWAIGMGVSGFLPSSLKLFSTYHFPMFFLFFITFYLVLKTHEYSLNVLTVLIFLVSAISLFYLLKSSNKLLLLLVFCYVVYSIYYFYQWHLIHSKAAFNPNFSKHDLDKTKRFALIGMLESSGTQYVGRITNLDADSFFIRFEEEVAVDLSRQVSLEAFVDNVKFQCKGKVYAVFDNGFGIIVDKKTQEYFSWKDYFSIISERSWI